MKFFEKLFGSRDFTLRRGAGPEEVVTLPAPVTERAHEGERGPFAPFPFLMGIQPPATVLSADDDPPEAADSESGNAAEELPKVQPLTGEQASAALKELFNAKVADTSDPTLQEIVVEMDEVDAGLLLGQAKELAHRLGIPPQHRG